MYDLTIHFHLFAAIAWIGGAIFMFVLGITLRDKRKQKEVYPNIGPIFGWYELVSLFILVTSGIIMIKTNGLYDALLNGANEDVVRYLKYKLLIVATLVVATAVHFSIAFKTNNKERTKLQHFLSRGTSLYIFMANLFVLHFAILIRNILH